MRRRGEEELWTVERRWKETPKVPSVVPDWMFLGDPGEVYRNYAFIGYRNYESLSGVPPGGPTSTIRSETS